VAPGGFPLVIQTWQTEDGLPHSVITDVVQGGDRYLWVATFNGLARFDGAIFRVFNSETTPALGDTWIDHVFATPDGTLWIGTHHGGLTSYRSGHFARELLPRPDADWVVNYLGNRDDDVVFLTQSGRIVCGVPGAMRVLDQPSAAYGRTAVMDGQGAVWFSREGKLEGRLSGSHFQPFSAASSVADWRCNDLCLDARGRLWMATDRGLALWTNQDFLVVFPSPGEPPMAVRHLYACRDGGLWVSANDRLRKWRDAAWVAEAETNGPPFRKPLTRVREDLRGNLWFSSFGESGSFGEGLWRLAPDGQTLYVGAAQGLPNDRVTGFCVDSENNLWVSLDHGGLARIRERRFYPARMSADAFAPPATSVCEGSNGALWIGTFGDGVTCLESNRMERYTSGRNGSEAVNFSTDGSKGYVMSVLADRQGRVWIGTLSVGVFWLTNGTFATPFPINEVGFQALAICEDRSDHIWFGNSLGLYRWSLGHLEFFSPPAGSPWLEVRTILDDGADGVWVGTRGQGLLDFRDGQWQSWRQKDGLGSDMVWALFADEQHALWLGTQGGLVRFKGGQFVRLTVREGLPSDAIYHLMSDGRGWLWGASSKGIFRMCQDELQAFARGAVSEVNCLTYDRADGLPTLECSVGSQPAGWRSSDGRLWFTTEKGVVEVDAAALSINTQAPPVVIEEMAVGQAAQVLPLLPDQAAAQREDKRPPPIRVGPGSKRLEFRFTALSFTAPEKVRFRYRLKGLEDHWLNAGNQRSVHYNSVPPGEYTFQVIACNDDGIWNETGAALSFAVLPWFWQTVLFKGLMGIAILGGSIAIVREVERQRAKRKMAMLERERVLNLERARIARDIHDDLGASLTQVGLLGELAGRGANTPAEVLQCSQRISGAAREMAQSLDGIVWALKPENDTLRNLIGYLERRTNELLESLPGRYTFAAPRQLPECIVAAEVRHDVFLAYKEALTNILKHAQASEVAVQVALNEGLLRIGICDNGRGFDPSRGRAEGSGLRNMRRRLEEIGGTFEVESRTGGGTRLRMCVPLAGRRQTHN
jgi:signal transduction histidine kinase/ligand-binding sensor domain-containing protein